MTRTITITDANKVKEGDIAHFTSTDITADVIAVTVKIKYIHSPY